MSGLDDSAEPAAQEAEQAQDHRSTEQPVTAAPETSIANPDVAPAAAAEPAPNTEPAAPNTESAGPESTVAPTAEPTAEPDGEPVAATSAEAVPVPEAEPPAESPVQPPATTAALSEAGAASEPPSVPEALPSPEPTLPESETVVLQSGEPVQFASHTEPEPTPAVEAEPVATVESEPTPAVEAEPVATVESEPTPAVEAEPVATVESEPTPAVEAEPVATVESEPVATAEPEPEPEPEPAAAAPAPPSSPEAAETGGVVDEAIQPAPEVSGSSTPSSEVPQPAAQDQPPGQKPQIGASATPAGATPPPAPGPRPKAATETGKIVEGVVTAVSAESVELTLDDGRPAVIHRRNFGLNDEEPSAVVSVGDRAFGAELAREDPKSRVVLSRAWALKRRAWERVVQAAADNQLLTGRVVSASKKGLVVDVGVRGFIPSSHLELSAVTDMSPYIDQTMELKILEVDPRREKLVLSRRSLLLKAQRKEMQELLTSLKPGEVRSGTVASLAEYGAFVDLGGVSGLVHISELSWRRVSKPSEVVSVGETVEVKVLDVKPKKKRISLSIRQITPDPLAELEVGAVVMGPVTRLVDFGAFVAIGEFEGLVHLSELAEYRVSTPEEIVAPGDEVGVKILSVDIKRRRIELSIRRAAEYGG